jgi:hypothetical protein
MHASGATAIKSFGHLSSSALLYLLLLVDCSIAQPRWAYGLSFVSLSDPSQTMESMVPADADMGWKIRRSPAPRDVPWLLCQACVCLGFCIDTAASGPERMPLQWDVLHAIHHHHLSSESMI